MVDGLRCERIVNLAISAISQQLVALATLDADCEEDTSGEVEGFSTVRSAPSMSKQR